MLSRVRELWQSVQHEARRAEKTRAAADALRTRIESAAGETEALRRATDSSLARFGGTAPPPSGAAPRLEVGARVRDRDLGVEGELVSGPDDEGRVTLRKGSWNIVSHVSRLEAPGSLEAEGTPGRPRGPSATWDASEAPPGLEVDLRGMEVDEALATLDQALDRAVLGSFSELRIVHGIGRGILRAVVERHLRGHPQVASQRLGAAGEGGRGATVARLR